MRLEPGELGKGYVRIGCEEFLVWGPDAPDPETFRRCTQVHGIGPLEHLSAAAAILGVRGWTLEADHGDLPLFDGSASTWAKMLAPFPREMPCARALGLESRTWEGEGRGILEIHPSEEFRLELELSGGAFGAERWEGTLADLGAILEARTFVDARDWWFSRQAGLLQGVDSGSGRLLAGTCPPPQEALDALRGAGVEPAGKVWTGCLERIPNECAAHKALDLVGDIACAIGYLPALRIFARDTGHTLHARLGRALRNAHRDKEGKSHATPVRPAGPHHA